MFQWYLSCVLVFEVDDYLVNAKFIRYISLISATIWNTAYIFSFFWLLDYLDDWGDRKIGADEMFIAMCIAYNLIVHFGILPINIVIMIKEFSMKYF